MDLDTLAQRQHGTVSTRQLRALGISKRAQSHALSRGRLVALRRGVFRVAGAPQTREQAWMAALLAAPDGAVLSHTSAAFAWRLRGYEQPGAIHLLTEGVRPALDGVVAHRTVSLPDDDRSHLRHVPVTTVARTLVDTCGVLPFPRFERAIDDALRRNILVLSRLVRCADRIPASGRRPIGPVHEVLRDRVPGYDPGGSDEELDVLRVLRRAGIRPLPVQQFRVTIDGRRYRLDYAWPDTKHVIEYDGAAFHDTAGAFHEDRARLRALQRHGWVVWPVTKRTSANELVAIGLQATTPHAA